MRILVTGGKGQLARDLARLAMDLGHEVSAPDLDELDITDFSAVSAEVGRIMPDAVVNCAAYNDVDGAETNWQDAFSVNGMGVKHLALACRERGAVLVHYSTDYVFDGTADKPYTIADMPNPISSYGQSKLLGEEMAASHAGRYFLIRTSWVFGEGVNSFPLKLLGWAKGRDTLRVVDDQVASPTYAEDLAIATLGLLATGNLGLYHITNSGHCSRYEWAQFILQRTGWQGTLERAGSDDFHTPARRPAYSVLDNFPAPRVLGGPMPSWQDATERFLGRIGAAQKETG